MKKKKNYPKISLITPSYNQGRYIEKTIRSVLDQNYPNLEYIIMDGGSTDGTYKILNKYQKKIIYISQKDRGQSDAINKGLRRASGQIIGYLNSDDILLKGSLYKITEYFSNNPQSAIVTGKCLIIDNQDRAIRSIITLYKNFWLIHARSFSTLKLLNYISQPATFWRSDIVKIIGYFNKQYHLSMDYDYWLRIMSNYKMGLINEYLAAFRIHEKSKGNKNFMKQFKESYNIVQKYTDSKFLLFLHHLHNSVILFFYRLNL